MRGQQRGSEQNVAVVSFATNGTQHVVVLCAVASPPGHGLFRDAYLGVSATLTMFSYLNPRSTSSLDWPRA